MTDVLAMPPVLYTARAQGLEDARSISRGINGKFYTSQYRKSRRMFDVSIDASEFGLGFSGYLEQLRRYQDGKSPVVQIEVATDDWHFSINGARDARGHGEIIWSYEGNPMQWLYTAQNLNIFYSGMDVTVGVDYGGNYLDVNVPTPNAIIAYAGERVVQGDTVGRVVNIATSDTTGNARIYVDTEFETGHLQISPPQWAYAFITDMPIPAQNASGGFEYSMSMTEVFETELPDDFGVLNPWR